MLQPMPIPKIADVVTNCWIRAEKKTRKLLADRHFDKDEEFITELFHGEFRCTVDKASEAGNIKEAFLQDLREQFPDIRDSFELEIIASGITANVSKHPKSIEGESGGDLGITFIRPNVTACDADPSVLNIDDDYRRGLLCQAKIKRRPSKGHKSCWGSFTTNQKKILPERLKYLSLLLYEYEDEQRHNLNPFSWQLCNGVQLDKVENWLKNGVFQNLTTSDRIIKMIGNDKIGTDDKIILKQYIDPEIRRALVVKIGWPPDKKPPSQVTIERNIQLKEEEQICIVRGR